MRAIIDAVKARLLAAGVTTYWIEVPDQPKYPYVLLWGPSWGQGEGSLGDCDSVDVPLFCTNVAVNPDLALTMSTRTRAVLDRAVFEVGSRHVEIKYQQSEIVDVDKQVTLPEPNRHPAFAVDAYRLYAA